MSRGLKKAGRVVVTVLGVALLFGWLAIYIGYEVSPTRICGERGSSVAFKDGDNFRCRDGYEGVKSLGTNSEGTR